MRILHVCGAYSPGEDHYQTCDVCHETFFFEFHSGIHDYVRSVDSRNEAMTRTRRSARFVLCGTPEAALLEVMSS